MRKAKKKEGGTWLVDHTNQIGQEKVLTILRVRSQPRPGVALRHQDMEVLATIPGIVWKREDVAKVYEQVAQRYGCPDQIATDGALELREPAEKLGKPGKRPLIFRDPKYFLANRLEVLLKRDPNYEAFVQKIGRSRSALQQTALARFIPPPFKPKARFMNLEPIIGWASAVLWHLNHPESSSCSAVSFDRLEEKLGWLRDFETSIQHWQTCQDVIDSTLSFLNQQGIFRGVVTFARAARDQGSLQPSAEPNTISTRSPLSRHSSRMPCSDRSPGSAQSTGRYSSKNPHRKRTCR